MFSKFRIFFFGLISLFLFGFLFPVLATDDNNAKFACFDAYVIDDPIYITNSDFITKYAGLKLVSGDYQTVMIDLHNRTGDTRGDCGDNNFCSKYAFDYADPIARCANGVCGHVVKLITKDQNIFDTSKKVYLLRKFTDDDETYWECAEYADGTSMCADLWEANSDLKETLHSPHDRTDRNEEFRILDTNINDNLYLNKNSDGYTQVNHVAAIDVLTGTTEQENIPQQFYGLQVVTTESAESGTAYSHTLQFATFSAAAEMEEGSSDCVSIAWDPFGKVIDAYTLEPIPDVKVYLKNKTNSGQLVNTTLANQPLFTNPFTTKKNGVFNFAVPNGTYYLYPESNFFTFPLSSETLSAVKQKLQSLDPTGLYINVNNLYNNSQEKIVEDGYPVRRDIVMLPKNANYQGSTVAIVQAENFTQDGKQLIRGRVSHPKSTVEIYAENKLLLSVIADESGAFNANLNNGLLGNAVSQITLLAKSKALTTQAVTKTSAPYLLTLIPNQLTGISYNAEGQVVTHAWVQIMVGDLVYYQTKSDKRGYFAVSGNNLPPFKYTIRILDSKTQNILDEQTIADFLSANAALNKTTSSKAYQPENTNLPEKPSAEILETAAKTKAVFSSNHGKNKTNNLYSLTPTSQTTVQNTKPVSPQIYLTLLIILVFTAGIILIFLFIKQKKHEDQNHF